MRKGVVRMKLSLHSIAQIKNTIKRQLRILFLSYRYTHIKILMTNINIPVRSAGEVSQYTSVCVPTKVKITQHKLIRELQFSRIKIKKSIKEVNIATNR